MNTFNKKEQTNVGDDIDISLTEIVDKIKGVIRFLQSKLILILAASIIGGTIGLAYTYTKKVLYTADLTFALEDSQSNSGFGGAMGLASQFGFDMGGGGGGVFNGDNLLQLMRSRSMIEKALLTPVKINGQTKTLADIYTDMNDIVGKERPGTKLFLPEVERSTFSRQQDSLLGELYKLIISRDLVVIKPDKKLSIISVKVTSSNELFSKYLSEILVKKVSDFYVETKTKKAVENVALLQRQTDSVRHVLNSAISGVAAFIDLNPSPNPAMQRLRVPSQNRQVDVQANQAILTELVKNLEISKVSLRRETPLIQIIDSPILPLNKLKPSKLTSILTGSILCVFISVFYLLITRYFILYRSK